MCQRIGEEAGEPVVTRRRLEKPDMERMNIPPEFWGASFGRLPPDVQGVLRPTLAGMAPGTLASGAMRWVMLVVGKAGAGKSSLAVVAGKEARRNGFTVLFVRASELADKLRSDEEFPGGGFSWKARAASVDLLILDSLSPLQSADQYVGDSPLSELVAQRGDRQRATILTFRTAEAKPVEVFGARFPLLCGEFETRKHHIFDLGG